MKGVHFGGKKKISKKGDKRPATLIEFLKRRGCIMSTKERARFWEKAFQKVPVLKKGKTKIGREKGVGSA